MCYIESRNRPFFIFGDKPMSGDSPWIRFAAEIPLAHFASHCAKTGVKNVLQVRFEGYENVDARRVLEENGMALYVENMKGYMRVKTGKAPSASDGVTPAVQTDGSAEPVRIVVQAEGSSGFYKVIRN